MEEEEEEEGASFIKLVILSVMVGGASVTLFRDCIILYFYNKNKYIKLREYIYNMFTFFKRLIHARQQWLNKPMSPVPNVAPLLMKRE